MAFTIDIAKNLIRRRLRLPFNSNILTPLSFFDNVLSSQEDRGWMHRRACTISLFGERFFWQEISKVFRPVHIKCGTIRPYPILLRAHPVEPRGQARGTSASVPPWGDIPAKSWAFIHGQGRAFYCRGRLPKKSRAL
jgi:hypothetical protein